MTKKEKTNCCQEILSRHHYGESVLKGDFDFLIGIFESHPQWAEKKGAGISEIKVQSTEYNNKCFCLYRTDGTSVDISYIHSIKNSKPEPKLASTDPKPKTKRKPKIQTETTIQNPDDVW